MFLQVAWLNLFIVSIERRASLSAQSDISEHIHTVINHCKMLQSVCTTVQVCAQVYREHRTVEEVCKETIGEVKRLKDAVYERKNIQHEEFMEYKKFVMADNFHTPFFNFNIYISGNFYFYLIIFFY